MNALPAALGWTRAWLLAAGLSGVLAVAAGAYGAHGLTAAETVPASFDAAQRYHLIHTVALLALSPLSARLGRLVDMAGLLLLAGMLLFCGTLYRHGLTGELWRGVAPAGGMALMAGWAMLAAAALFARPRPVA